MEPSEPKDFQSAQLIITELKKRCRAQAEQILKWKKAYALQVQQHFRFQKEKNDQMNTLTSQLLLLESRLKRKQKQIAGIICQRDLTIMRQQKLIDTLSSRLVDHGLDTLVDPICTDFDSLNDSDSAVVLEDIDSDCNSSFSMRRKSYSGSVNSDVTIVRSISDAIDTNLNNKYSISRRSNCFLRRPDILETVYSVEEDTEPTSQQLQQQQPQQLQQQQCDKNNDKNLNNSPDVAEKRDKFKNRSERAINDHSIDRENYILKSTQSNPDQIYYKSNYNNNNNNNINHRNSISHYYYHQNYNNYQNNYNNVSMSMISINENNLKQSQVTNFNRVMSNHRSVTKPKDVKYKRINKAKSKSLEELRGRLKHWVERGSISSTGGGAISSGGNSSHCSSGNNSTSSSATALSITDKLAQTAQSYA